MSDYSVISRPYARAAFEVAQSEAQLAQWSEQLALVNAVVSNEALASALENPRVERKQLADLVIEACGQTLSQSVSNLIHLMAENRRLAAFPGVVEGFEALRAQAEARLPVTVRSATEMAAAQRQQLEAKLKARFGREVEAQYELDRDLLGGAVIEAGDVIIDGSLRNKLERLNGALHKG